MADAGRRTGRPDPGRWDIQLPDPRQLDFGRPGLRDTVKIGGQWYRGVDNGRANVLVPISDANVSPALRASRREGMDRFEYMAAHPFGSIAYGIAALGNASPRGRDKAMKTGGLIDESMFAVAPLAARAPRVAPPRPGSVAPPTLPQPAVRYGQLSKDGQASTAAATISRPIIGTGTRAPKRMAPAGWGGNPKDLNEARGHLIAKILGGLGNDPRNLVTLTHHGANTPQMRDFEKNAARRVRKNGEIIDYMAQPLDSPGTLPPSDLLLTARTSRGDMAARIIRNPAGRRK